jgi:hypothetical protein
MRVTKSRRMRQAGHVARRNLKGRDHSKDLSVDGDNIRMYLRETRWEAVD